MCSLHQLESTHVTPCAMHALAPSFFLQNLISPKPCRDGIQALQINLFPDFRTRICFAGSMTSCWMSLAAPKRAPRLCTLTAHTPSPSRYSFGRCMTSTGLLTGACQSTMASDSSMPSLWGSCLGPSSGGWGKLAAPCKPLLSLAPCALSQWLACSISQ